MTIPKGLGEFRNRVRHYADPARFGSKCRTVYDAAIEAINLLVRHINTAPESVLASKPFEYTVATLGTEVEKTVGALLSSLDPNDKWFWRSVIGPTLKVQVFFGPKVLTLDFSHQAARASLHAAASMPADC